ncbi:MAG: hypothetical protein HZA54_05120 [Planctomycetes bacterium]|nr:hypothetical protein [Planctomycetota bacterium]
METLRYRRRQRPGLFQLLALFGVALAGWVGPVAAEAPPAAPTERVQEAERTARELFAALARGERAAFLAAVDIDECCMRFELRYHPAAPYIATEKELPALYGGVRKGYQRVVDELGPQFEKGRVVIRPAQEVGTEVHVTAYTIIDSSVNYLTLQLATRLGAWRIVNLRFPFEERDILDKLQVIEPWSEARLPPEPAAPSVFVDVERAARLGGGVAAVLIAFLIALGAGLGLRGLMRRLEPGVSVWHRESWPWCLVAYAVASGLFVFGLIADLIGERQRKAERLAAFKAERMAARAAANQSDAVRRAAFAAARDGTPEHALQLLAQIPEQVAASVELNQLQVRLLLGLGRVADAEQVLLQMLERRPTSPLAHHQLGALAERAGRYPEAVGHFRAAMAALGEDALLLMETAWAEVEAGRLDSAEREIERALALAPLDPPALLCRARIRVRTGARAEALADLELAARQGGIDEDGAGADDDLGKLADDPQFAAIFADK